MPSTLTACAAAKSWCACPAPAKRHFVTLDGQERRVDPETLFICDAEGPVALAGIMGGQVSEVSPDTHRVLIESAYFNPPHIRRASKRLGLSTESSYRFERGVDPDGVILALDRAAQLMAALGGGQVLQGRIDVYPTPVPRPRLALRVSRANRVIGTELHPGSGGGLVAGPASAHHQYRPGHPGGAGAVPPGGPGAGDRPHRGGGPVGGLWGNPGDPAPRGGGHPPARPWPRASKKRPRRSSWARASSKW